MPLAAIKELLACDPADAAERIAAHWREVESAHDARRELADQWQLAIESIQAWEQEHGDEDERLALTPEDLGMRITYLAIGAATYPDCDFAVPFVVER